MPEKDPSTAEQAEAEATEAQSKVAEEGAPAAAPAGTPAVQKVRLSDGRELSPDEAVAEIERLQSAEREFKKAYTKTTTKYAQKLREATRQAPEAQKSGGAESSGAEEDPVVDLLEELYEDRIERGKDKMEKAYGPMAPAEEAAYFRYLREFTEKHGTLPPLEDAYRAAVWQRFAPKPVAKGSPASPAAPKTAAAGSSSTVPEKDVRKMSEGEYREYMTKKYPNLFRGGL